MEQEAWNCAEGGHEANPASAMAEGIDEDKSTEKCNGTERPPVIDSAGEGEEHVAPEGSFFKESGAQKAYGPEQGEFEYSIA